MTSRSRRTLITSGACLAAFALGACSDGPDGGASTAPAPSSGPSRTAAPSTPVRAPTYARYEPGADEEFANGKRVAGRIAQRVLTYARGTTARDVAAAFPAAQMASAPLARVLGPAVHRDFASAGKVVYPQLSGVTASSLGAMVVCRQTLVSDQGRLRHVTRVLDIRLRLVRGKWRLDQIASVGGSPVRRRPPLSRAARRVLGDPRIRLPDTARWDVERGLVDDSLLGALSKAADRHRLAISVFRTGHPPNVWGTERPSAHSRGFAADIYAVDRRPVIAQREAEGPAYDLARALVAGGLRQIGSPWVLEPGGSVSFTDPVHQDHIHIQESPVA